MPNRIVLHVPLRSEVYDDLKKYAHELGYDSAQAYIRKWATAQSISRGTERLKDHNKAMAVRYFELILALRPSDFPTVTHAVDYVLRELYNSKMRDYLHKILDNRGKI
jgi:hypothetical protein